MDRIGKAFIEGTKYHNLARPDRGQDSPQPPLALDWDRTKQPIPLPPPKAIRLGGLSVREAIDRRRTLRTYSRAPLDPEELSYLLWCTQGVQEVVPGFRTMRTVPSAGARHAFETYLCLNNVSGLRPGLYRFLALEHALLEENLRADFADRLAQACLGQEAVKTCAATFVWTAVVCRMTYRYGERGYRYLYLDAGHVCQSLYLAAEAIGCGVCAIGAFSDDEVNRLLCLDGEDRFAIYLGAVGKK